MIGLDKYITAVSGISVGALNVAMFVDGNYEKKLYLLSWLNHRVCVIYGAHDGAIGREIKVK